MRGPGAGRDLPRAVPAGGPRTRRRSPHDRRRIELFLTSAKESGRALPGLRRITRLENQRTLYDGIALSLAVLPLLVFYFTLLTAPIAIFIAIRHWNTPRSIVRRTRIRLVLAIILATIQIIGWGVAAYFLLTATKSHG